METRRGNLRRDSAGAAHRRRQKEQKRDQNGFNAEFLGPEASLALVKKTMVEDEAMP